MVSHMNHFVFAEVPKYTRQPRVIEKLATSLRLKWPPWSNPPDEGAGPVTQYVVEYKEVGANSWNKIGSISETEVEITGLAQNSQYEVHIFPLHRDGYQGFAGPPLMVKTCGSKYA